MSGRFKTVRVPIGAYAPNYRPGSKRRAHEAAIRLEQETGEQSRATLDTLMREQALKWGVAPEDVDLFITNPAAYRAMMDERERVKDEAARNAVEGGAA